ncbi:hypothetical protein C8F01DRAFT_1249044 [Mycena amicta]|nr:hypothetical protein C8F01DRAFT_1249044 [Mycena amicta]
MPSGDKSAAIAAAKPKVVRPVPDGFKKCTGTTCQHHIPLSDKAKKCAGCREANRLATARSRANRKKKTAEQARAKEGETGDHSEGDREVEHEERDERPRKKPRVATGDANSDVDSDDEPGTSYQVRVSKSYLLYAWKYFLMYGGAEKLFEDLRTIMQTTPDVHFKGRFTLQVSAGDTVDAKTRVQSTNREIAMASGLRWTVHDNKKLKTGHSTRYWCSQDEARKKAPKPSTRPGAQPRKTPGMDCFRIGVHNSTMQAHLPAELVEQIISAAWHMSLSPDERTTLMISSTLVNSIWADLFDLVASRDVSPALAEHFLEQIRATPILAAPTSFLQRVFHWRAPRPARPAKRSYNRSCRSLTIRISNPAVHPSKYTHAPLLPMGFVFDDLLEYIDAHSLLSNLCTLAIEYVDVPFNDLFLRVGLAALPEQVEELTVRWTYSAGMPPWLADALREMQARVEM